jgi:hypothetical protein
LDNTIETIFGGSEIKIPQQNHSLAKLIPWLVILNFQLVILKSAEARPGQQKLKSSKDAGGSSQIRQLSLELKAAKLV